ncbi:MAG: glycosyltransferase family 4 protein [Paracoccus sp. (in: a-proteobacteria)]|nr:glycosyltransferase family 4 protein [Paracoccus sp. (in: a-proteobacteria)]
MTQKPIVRNDASGEILFRAAEAMSIAGRSASRRRLLQEAARRGSDLQTAQIWHDRAASRKDFGYIRDLSLPLTSGRPETALPEWLMSARNEADIHTHYCAEELRYRLDILQPGPVSDRSGPLCYVLHMSLPESSSGYAVRSHHLMRAMQKLGIDPYCVTRLGFPGDTDLPSEAVVQVIDGVSYHRILQPGKRNFRNIRYAVDAARALVEKLGPLQPRAIMAASNHENAAPALLAARYLGVPFIYDMRGFWELSSLSVNPQNADTPQFHKLVQMEAELARQADLVFTLTDAMRGELRRRGVGNPAIYLLPNAADPEAFQPRPRNSTLAQKLGIGDSVPVIGYIGSFNLYEGLDDIVRACVKLHRKGQDFRLLMIGSEPPYLEGRITNEIRQIAVEGGISDKLLMPGRVPVNEVEQWYSLVDIVPLPRKDMPVTELVSPLKPLEAMAMEKAVVVTDLSALKEIVMHQDTGIVVPCNNTDALADALVDLITNPEVRRALGKRARERVVAERNWDAVTRHLRDALSQVL